MKGIFQRFLEFWFGEPKIERDGVTIFKPGMSPKGRDIEDELIAAIREAWGEAPIPDKLTETINPVFWLNERLRANRRESATDCPVSFAIMAAASRGIEV